jgi:hypothetical protein
MCKRGVGASHSATSAIESALNNVSLHAHWIVHRLATAGGKLIKTRLLSTVVTSHYYDYNKTTASLRVQWSLTSMRQDYSLSKCRTITSFADQYKSPKRCIPSATAHRQPSAEKLGWLPTHCPLNPACCHLSVPAFGCAQMALFRAHTFSSVATFAIRKLPACLHIQQARTVV